MCSHSSIDPWPPDIYPNGAPNRVVSGQDIGSITPSLFQDPANPIHRRYDLNASGSIAGQDIGAVTPWLFQGCQPPP